MENIVTRLTQLGVFTSLIGAVTLFLGLFPNAVGLSRASGIGIAQITIMLIGLFTLTAGAYVTVYSILHRGTPTTLLRQVGVRLGMTGFVFSAASTIADILGFGSHTTSGEPLFGWLQAAGMITGFAISAIGVLTYGAASSQSIESSPK